MQPLVTLRRQDLMRLPASERGTELLELVPDPRPGPEEEVASAELASRIRRLVARLPGRERQVIVASFGLGGRAELSLRQIASRLRCSKTGAWRLRDQGLGRLRAQLGPAEEWL